MRHFESADQEGKNFAKVFSLIFKRGNLEGERDHFVGIDEDGRHYLYKMDDVGENPEAFALEQGFSSWFTFSSNNFISILFAFQEEIDELLGGDSLGQLFTDFLVDAMTASANNQK